MKRTSRRELDLETFADRHRWRELIADQGHDPARVFDALYELMLAMPSRRRVRAMELAALVEARLVPAEPERSAIFESLVTSLRSDHRHAFLVDRARPIADRPSVLLTSTPRSGNTLLQRLFHEVLGYPILGAPTIDDIAVETVTAPALMQIHAVRNRRALRFVADLRAKVVTVGRHPLDVLLSILHFSRHETQILDWLDGEWLPTPPTALQGAAPTSPAFVEWASGRGAAQLLAISQEWWKDPATYRIRYEDLIASTGAVVTKMADDLHIARPGTEADDVDPDEVRQHTLVDTPNHHRWRSTADGWRDLLPGATAQRIYQAHRSVFDDLGYDIEGPYVDADEAMANWRSLKK